ncbi:hypothetical protein [Yersinia ruckeri]|uniref:hypothetical protein n=1 Tax=Yersinia ruckeri TaxID=29486 RepID=UPI00398B5FA9
MKTQYLAQPIMSTDQKLLGVEVLTRFQKDGQNLLSPTPAEIIQGWSIQKKRAYLIDLIYFISKNESFFIENELFCSLNIDLKIVLLLKHDAYIQVLLQSMPYVKLQISEDFPNIAKGIKGPDLKFLFNRNNSLFFNYLGIGNINIRNGDISGFEVVKIDEGYFSTQFYRSSLPVLISNIKKYCPKIIVSGVFSTELLKYLQEWDIWGVQGELYGPVLLRNVNTFIFKRK